MYIKNVNIQLTKPKRNGKPAQLGFLDIRRLDKFARTKKQKMNIKLLIGARGTGKTTSMRLKIHELIKRKEKFMWAFRTKDELQQKKHSVLNDLKGNLDLRIVNTNEIHLFIQEEEYKKNGTPKTKKKNIDKGIVGYFADINNATTYRSGANFNDLKVFVFDEFMEENGKEVTNEVAKLFSLLETGFRNRDFDNYLIANEIDPNHSLFHHLGIYKHPDHGQLLMMPERRLAYYRVYKTEMMLKKTKTSVNNAFRQGSDYDDFANGQFKINNGSRILPKPINLEPKYNLILNRKIYGVYEFKYKEKKHLWIGIKYNENSRNWALDNDDLNYFQNTFLLNKALYIQKINTERANNTLWFQNKEIMELFGLLI